MTDVKRILIVEDDFEVALFLRAALEVTGSGCEVLTVPSGEEGMLVVRGSGADLVITDLNLPGIDGLEFIDQVHRSAPDTPVVAITGELSPKLHEQVRSLELEAFFLKPIPVDDLTATVLHILEEELPEEFPAAGESHSISPEIFRRLRSLRIDTGAHYATLVDTEGACVAADGQPGELDAAEIASLLAIELRNSLELARALKASEPSTINYQAGAAHDIYSASVGTDHIMALVFDAERGSSRIGAVWMYARRAVKELLELLRTPAVPPETEPEPVEPPPRPPAPPPPETGFALPTEEVEAFWERALSEEALRGSVGLGGISLEDARAQGLIPSDFDLSR
ncbi:MAG: response regulator [Ardenticatenales bacterium]|nr:response regulator [Ardenticatenales bacterium]